VRQSVPGHSGVIGPTEPAGLVARCLLMQPVGPEPEPESEVKWRYSPGHTWSPPWLSPDKGGDRGGSAAVEPTVVAAKEHCDKYEMKDMDMNRVISCRLRSSRE
jgi:hypothetical protein